MILVQAVELMLTCARYFPTVYEPTVFENYVHGKNSTSAVNNGINCAIQPRAVMIIIVYEAVLIEWQTSL